ncbi:MAG: threonine synthase [Gammaproteobacteria bacterium PRO9]|nr:threonine synthase [Gammaproteobacteria bacterium PRO9]
MRYVSTRGGPPVAIEQAIMGGTAGDGGLYVPESLPSLDPRAFGATGDNPGDLPAVAREFLEPFFGGTTLHDRLGQLCRAAFSFPIPLRPLEVDPGVLKVLELFHGPTAAFKDVGARFLAHAMEQIIADGQVTAGPVTVLVATSGDTGGAVAAAFHRRPGTRVVVLFPDGRVSPRQQHQLTCWGDNVTSLAVRGGFDDCQRLVKAAFADSALRARHRLCSANSINVGRLLPQAAYYAHASLAHWQASGRPLSFIVPTGNLGNGFACVWARRAGMPIDRIILATNANTTIPDFLATGQWLPRPSVATLASAMDVGEPSNMERLRNLCTDVDGVRQEVSAVPVTDAGIRATIVDEYRRHGLAWCPHTATALHVYRELPAAERSGRDWAVVATAHAAKFDTIVEPLLGTRIAMPPELAAILERPAHFERIDADLAALVDHL